MMASNGGVDMEAFQLLKLLYYSIKNYYYIICLFDAWVLSPLKCTIN